MKRRRLRIAANLVLSLFVAWILAGCGGGAPQQGGAGQEQKAFTLRVADMTPPTASTAQVFEWWGSEIEKRTNGRVKFEYFWSASLVGAYEQLEAVKTGNIDVTPYYSGYHPDLAPLPLIALMPLINTGPLKQALLASDELFRTHPALQAEFKKNNVKYLYPVYNPDWYIWSRRKPVDSLDDLKGLNLRAFGPWLTLFQELGAKVVSLPVPEIYDALERGALDATAQFLPNATGARYWEVTKYVNITNLGHNVGCPAVMNLDRWNSLPPDIQQIIEQVSAEAVKKSAEIDAELHARDMKAIQEHGMVVTEFSAADMEKLRQIAKEKVWDPYVAGLEKKGIPGTDVLNTYLQLLAKYAEAK